VGGTNSGSEPEKRIFRVRVGEKILRIGIAGKGKRKPLLRKSSQRLGSNARGAQGSLQEERQLYCEDLFDQDPRKMRGVEVESSFPERGTAVGRTSTTKKREDLFDLRENKTGRATPKTRNKGGK